MAENESVPAMDHVQEANDQTEAALLDAVMRNSPIMEEVGEPLPEEEITEVDPEESDEVDPEESEEAVSEEEEEVEDEAEETEDEDAADEAATQETEVYTADDLDLDALVSVKVDGEELEVSFGDLLKGYQTDAHLSKKGRELGEAQKSLEEDHAKRLEALDTAAKASASILYGAEQSYAKEYHEIEEKIEKARKDGDTYEVNELKDKREQVQKHYWNARKNREATLEAVQKQREEVEAKAWQEQMEHFQEEIPNLIPDFDDEVATNIRQFAIDEGIDPDILDQITDPKIVKFVDDYRRLKQGVTKGTAKRKATRAKKAVPTKKAPPAQKKEEDKAKMIKARAFKEDATEAEQMEFLRGHASRSLNL